MLEAGELRSKLLGGMDPFGDLRQRIRRGKVAESGCGTPSPFAWVDLDSWRTQDYRTRKRIGDDFGYYQPLAVVKQKPKPNELIVTMRNQKVGSDRI